jgi:hypothetical protein
MVGQKSSHSQTVTGEDLQMNNILPILGVFWGASYYIVASVMLTRAYFLHFEHRDPSGSLINGLAAAGMLAFGSVLYSATNGPEAFSQVII